MPPSHINDIAAELLGRIFVARLEEVQDDGRTLLELARVCKHWKDVSFRHPRLWATLHPKFTPAGKPMERIPPKEYDLHDLMAKFVDHLGRWFSRAGNLPLFLDVTLHPMPADPFLSYIAECPRWKSLCIRDLGHNFEWTWLEALMEATQRKSEANQGHPSWPYLTSLGIETPVYTTVGEQLVASSFSLAHLQAAAPNLQALSVVARIMNTPTMIHGFHEFSLESLTELTIHGIDEDRNPTFMYHIFVRAKNVESLSLLKGPGTFRDPPPPTVIRPAPTLPIVHQKLRQLVLGLSQDLLKAVMENVQLSSMRSLQLVTTSSGSYNPTSVVPQWLFPFLHRITWKNPSFWPKLRQFSFGHIIDPCVIEMGDGDFEAFKDDPAAWAQLRDY